jgi:hypothetical protein
MSEQKRVGVAHFTNVAHLATIIQHGLLSDDLAKSTDRLKIDVGDQSVKTLRATRVVPVEPGGAVSSYVPFYFAQRSPMLFKIWKGQVHTYSGGQEPLIYLVSSIGSLVETGCQVVVTDGNAANSPTKFSNDVSDVESFLDREVLKSKMWNNTPEDLDRMRRRMAECLAKDRVPFAAVEKLVVQTETTATTARAILSDMGMELQVDVNPGWYYP